MIEGLRAIASVSVVLFHVSRHLERDVGWSVSAATLRSFHCGVDLFFVISGFLIYGTHRVDIGKRVAFSIFLTKRFIRIWPVYWLALALTITAAGLGGHHSKFWDVVWATTLLPTFAEPIVGVAWTLQYETVFYLLVSMLILSRPFGTVLLGIWIALMAVDLVGFELPLPSALTGLYGIEFLFGMLVFRTRRLNLSGRLLFSLGLLLFVGSMLAETYELLDGIGNAGRVFYGIGAACLLSGLIRIESEGFSAPNWLQVIGSATYPIYLFQFIFIGFVGQLYHRTSGVPPYVAFVIFSVVAVGGGMIISQRIERPLCLWLRDRLT